MANEQNLRPFTSEQSREAAVKNGRKGGKATAKKNKERKTFREGLLLLLNEPLKDKSGNVTDNTTQDAIIAALVKRAANGDTRAFEMIRDTIGEKPDLQLKMDARIKDGDFEIIVEPEAGDTDADQD
jgi:hypothetical protein